MTEYEVLLAVLAQASRYGEQVRLLEDQDLQKDRANVRKAWMGFRRQFEEERFYPLIRHAYYDAYWQ